MDIYQLLADIRRFGELENERAPVGRLPRWNGEINIYSEDHDLDAAEVMVLEIETVGHMGLIPTGRKVHGENGGGLKPEARYMVAGLRAHLNSPILLVIYPARLPPLPVDA